MILDCFDFGLRITDFGFIRNSRKNIQTVNILPMKNLIVLIALAFVMMACAHGKTEHFPDVRQTEDAAEVFIIRNNNLLGMGISLKVLFDKNVIARIRAGEHVSFFIEPGFHAVGTSDTTLTVPFAAGHKYYFLISAQYSQFGFEFERISSLKGENWVAKTKQLE